MVHALKFAIIQGMLLAAIAAGLIAGLFAPVLKSDARWVIAGLSIILIYGLISVFRKKWDSMAYASETLVRCGIVALQVAMAAGIASMTEVGKDGGFLVVIATGIISSVFALGSSIYLDAHRQFLGDGNEA